jgi:hypothetical protein
MDAETKAHFSSHHNRLDKIDNEVDKLWSRLDRLPRWAVLFIGFLTMMVGSLGTSLLHVFAGSR